MYCRVGRRAVNDASLCSHGGSLHCTRDPVTRDWHQQWGFILLWRVIPKQKCSVYVMFSFELTLPMLPAAQRCHDLPCRCWGSSKGLKPIYLLCTADPSRPPVGKRCQSLFTWRVSSSTQKSKNKSSKYVPFKVFGSCCPNPRMTDGHVGYLISYIVRST